MIVLATLTDVKEIVALEENSLKETLGEEMITSLIQNELTRVYVYKEDNKIIGYISYLFDGAVVEIYNLAVLDKYQGQGIGTKILDYVVNIFKNDDVSYILEVRVSNYKAINLYKKFNFKEIRVRKNYYVSEDALVLARFGE